MGLMDKIRRATLPTEDSYNYASDDEYYGGFEGNVNDVEDNMSAAPSASLSGMSSGSTFNLSSASLELKVVKPQHFDSVPQIADHLLNKRTVVLNLENTNKETARRLIDFLSGVAYSINGSLKKIASNAYVITPDNVDVGDAQLKDKRRPEPQAEKEDPADSVDVDLSDL